MITGWVKLHRKLLDWEWYGDGNTMRLFIHLLLTVNHEPKNWRGIAINPGQIVTGRIKLSKETGLTEQQIRLSLNKLKRTSCITIKPTNKYSLITLSQWEEYQDTTKKRTNKHPTTEPTNNQQTTTTKEGKEIKNNNSTVETLDLYPKDLLDFISKRNTKKKIKGRRGLMRCNGPTKDLLAIRRKRKGEYGVDGIHRSVGMYVKSIMNRPEDMSDHRFSLFSYLTQKNGIVKFYNQ